MGKPMTFAGVMLKNLFSKPVTKPYPEKPAVFQERTRGHVEIDIADCILCGNCARNCPPLAIEIDRTKGVWSISRFDCVQCGYCTDVCPKKCLRIVPGYPEPMPGKSVERIEKPDYAPPAPPAKAGAAAAPANGKPVSDLTQCIYCTVCAKKCPQNAITVDRAAKTWALTSPDDCLSCGICATSCPKKCITLR